MPPPIYLDNNATTLVDERVIAAMWESFLSQTEGNPSSQHSFGQRARQRLERARLSIADSLAVRPTEIVFTSGGTEAVGMLLHGIIQSRPQGHLITSNVEHACLLAPMISFQQKGLRCTFLEAGKWGAPTPESVKAAICRDTRLIALMAVNNETGVKTDLAAIAQIAEAEGIPLIVDGVALMGKEHFTIPPGVTAMAFSGHKFHAPKGTGFAVIKGMGKFAPLLMGGGQEFGLRAGTENLPGIVGLATAIQLLQEELPAATFRMETLRDQLEKELMSHLEGVSINGQGPRIANTTNLAFEGVEGEVLLASLDLAGIAISHGSACASGALEPSRVLLQMGCSKEIASTSIRISLSRMTTAAEIERTIDTMIKIVNKLR